MLDEAYRNVKDVVLRATTQHPLPGEGKGKRINRRWVTGQFVALPFTGDGISSGIMAAGHTDPDATLDSETGSAIRKGQWLWVTGRHRNNVP